MHLFLTLTTMCAGGFLAAPLTEIPLHEQARARFATLPAVPDDTTASSQAQLGRVLFWDKRLSSDGQTSCATCHLPEDGGADRRPFSVDAKGRNTSRNSQSVFNAVLQPTLRWTGDRRSGAHQAERSLTGSLGFESPEAAVQRLRELDYEAAFSAAFPGESDPVSTRHFGTAIEAYEATLLTPAPFDRYLNGEHSALTKDQKAGLQLFIDKGCVDCHHGPLLGGESLEKFGTVRDYWTETGSKQVDEGLFLTTKKEEDRYRFRVSMLRNVAKTAPYFHDGSVSELADAVRIMGTVQLGIELPDTELTALVAFLRSLSGEVPTHYSPPASLPNAPGQ